ncbi:MAG: ATP-binding protein, partial [Syntrophaceticus sp.]
GVTTQQYIYVASRERKFRIGEILVIDDPELKPRGEVVETKSFNRFLPLTMERSPLIDPAVWDGLEQVGFHLGEETIHLAKVRVLSDIPYPVAVGADVHLPSFAEVEDLLLSCPVKTGLVLGVILGTEDMQETLPEELKGIAPLYKKGEGILPQRGVPFVFDHHAMQEYPHIGIFGGSGSGKSFGMRVILEELLEKQIPTLVFDPHYEMSFATPFEGMDEARAKKYQARTEILTVGRDTGVSFEDLTSNDLVSLLTAAGGQFTEGMDNALKTIHQGKDSFISFAKKLDDCIGLAEKEEETLTEIRKNYGEHSAYEKKIVTLARQAGHPSSLRGIRWRLHRLNREGIFQKDIEPIINALNRRHLTVIRGPIWLLTVFSAYLIRKLYGMRRNYLDAIQRGDLPGDKFPPFIIVTDEAHNFARRGIEFVSPARSIFREVAQEGRKYGVFMVLATQRPALLDETITAQLNTKIIFRTVRASDIKVIQEETDISGEEAGRLPYLSSGTAFVSSAVVGRTVSVRIRCAWTQAPRTVNPFTELENDFGGVDEEFYKIITNFLPLHTGQISLYLPDIENALNRTVTIDEVQESLEELVAEGKLNKVKDPFGFTYNK